MDYTVESWEKFLGQVKVEKETKTAYQSLSYGILTDLFADLETLDCKVCKVFMSAKTYVAVRKWGRDQLEKIETDAERLKKGILAEVLGAEIVVQAAIPDSTVVAVSDNISGKPSVVILTLGQGTPYTERLVKLMGRVSEIEKVCRQECSEIQLELGDLIAEAEKGATQ